MSSIEGLFLGQSHPPLGTFVEADVLRRLGDGLVLRRASAADTDALCAFNRCAHADPPDFGPETFVDVWTRELMDGSHPAVGPRDFTIVEDASTQRVVSSLCLIPQRVSYGGVEVGLGQIELVGTHPDFRRRGLVAAQIEVVHDWSAQRGQLMQLIHGIPWYYRQFGYEMAVETHGLRRAYTPQVAAARESGAEATPLRARAATTADAPLVSRAYAQLAQRSALGCLHDEAQCAFETRRAAGSLRERQLRVLEDLNGEPQIVVAVYPLLWKGSLFVTLLERVGPVSWERALAALFDELQTRGEALRKADGSFDALAFGLGTQHPFYASAASHLPEVGAPYAQYLRIPDLCGFLQAVAPALEERLSASPLAGYDGTLSLNEYRRGVRLVFTSGKLARVEPWHPTTEERGDASFPGHSLLHLIAGHRSLGELTAFYPDCSVEGDAARGVLEAMFPKGPSQIILAD